MNNKSKYLETEIGVIPIVMYPLNVKKCHGTYLHRKATNVLLTCEYPLLPITDRIKTTIFHYEFVVFELQTYVNK